MDNQTASRWHWAIILLVLIPLALILTVAIHERLNRAEHLAPSPDRSYRSAPLTTRDLLRIAGGNHAE